MGRDVTGLRVSFVKTKPVGVSKASTTISVAKPVENSNADDVIRAKIPHVEDAKSDVTISNIEEAKSSSSEETGIVMTSAENMQPTHMVEKSSDVTGDQNGCASPVREQVSGSCSNTYPKLHVLPSPSPSKKSQSNSTPISKKHLDDEDNWSTGSLTTTSGRAARFKTTVAVAPKFHVTERLEKRKEYYTKLEEKQKALELEKLEYEARNKEEEQAVIKQIRKSMVYKANPVPNFYYSGPPPKKELKKLPTTRAVSPNIGRRKSCSDAASSSAEPKTVCARATRYSLENHSHNYMHKQGSVTPTGTLKKKASVSSQNGKSKLKNESSKQQKTKDSSPEPAKDPLVASEYTKLTIQT